jgi:four helix bundle protein
VRAGVNHKDLDVWKKSIGLVKDIYKLTDYIPECEKFGLTSQIRRAVVSIPSNIAEGSARNGDKEFVQFLYISLGSLSEVETQLIIAKELGYLEDIDNDLIRLEQVKKMILGLVKYLKGKNNAKQ